MSSSATDDSDYAVNTSSSEDSSDESTASDVTEHSEREAETGSQRTDTFVCFAFSVVFLCMLAGWLFAFQKYISNRDLPINFNNNTIKELVENDLCTLPFPLMLSTDLSSSLKTQLLTWMCSASFVQGMAGHKVSAARVRFCSKEGLVMTPDILQQVMKYLAVDSWCQRRLEMSCHNLLSLDLNQLRKDTKNSWGAQLLGFSHAWWLIESARRYYLSPSSVWEPNIDAADAKLLVSLDTAIVLAYLSESQDSNLKDAFLLAVIGAPLILKNLSTSDANTWEERELFAFEHLFPKSPLESSMILAPQPGWIPMNPIALYWAVRVESFCAPRLPLKHSYQALSEQSKRYLDRLNHFLVQLAIQQAIIKETDV